MFVYIPKMVELALGAVNFFHTYKEGAKSEGAVICPEAFV